MTRPSRAKFQAFEFDEDDRLAERASHKFRISPSNRDFKKAKNRGVSPIAKYHFLQCFTQDIKTQEEDCTEVVNLEASYERREKPGTNSRTKQLEDDPAKMEILSDPSPSISSFHIKRREKCMMNFKNKLLEDGPVKMEILSDPSTSSSSSLNERCGKPLMNPMNKQLEDGPVRMEIPSDPFTSISSFRIERRENSTMNSKNKQLEDGAIRMEILSDPSTSSSSSCKIEPVGTVSREPSYTEATSTFNCPGIQVHLEKQPIELDSGGYENDRENFTVKIHPTISLYRDSTLAESTLTFSCDGIKLEASPTLAATFPHEWKICDIMNIKAEWCASSNYAMVSLYLRLENSEGSGNANKTSGFELLRFLFYDPNWRKAQEAIKALNVRYKEIWNTDFDIDMVRGEKEILGQTSIVSPERYISGSDEPFEDVIYPKGDRDAIIITKRDIERLKPETFLNDTIIDFYIKYLASQIGSNEKHRFHFFNSFFFRKLADLDKDRLSAYEGKVSFQRVRKWTRKVNIFEKDFIFIPVNYSLHWSLLVICYPGEVANSKDEECESLSKVPCILHMDSIRGSHKGLKNIMQRYLCEEWKERHNGTAAEEASSRFLSFRYVPLELPQQENLSDCGLFLLHYVEKFVAEVPLEFSPFYITRSSDFLSRNWFPPSEASHKRYFIKKLIYKIREEHWKNAPEADGIEKDPSAESDNEEAEIIVIEQVSSGLNDEEVGISSWSKSTDDCFLRRSGACPRSYTHEDYLQSRTHHGNAMSPIEEVEETDEQVPETPLLGVKDSKEVTVLDDDDRASGTSGPATSLKEIPETEEVTVLDLVVEDSEEREDEVGIVKFTGSEKSLRSSKHRFAETPDFRGRNRFEALIRRKRPRVTG